MGCDAKSYLVSSDTLRNNFKSYDVQQWFQYTRNIPDVGGRPAETFIEEISRPQDLWFLWDFCKLNKLAENVNRGWCVIEINNNNINTLIDFCKQIIIILLNVESKKDLEKTKLKDLYYDKDSLINFCYLLQSLQINRACLTEYPNHSILMLIYW